MTIAAAIKSIEAMYLQDQASWNGDSNSKLLIKHTERLKKIVAEFGCIDIPRFGQNTSHYAWLIVQHANHDIAFQEEYLALMLKSEVLNRDVAYLTDRIAILRGEPQTYGTQFDPATLLSNYSPYPIKNMEVVDQRREAMGLNTMEEHKDYMHRKYKK